MEAKKMRNRFRLLALVLGITLIGCSCTKTPTNEGEPLHTQVDSTGSKKNENQDKLDVLRPVAYGDVKSLRLEPGSYISIIGRYSDDSYWEQVEAGAERAVEDINDMMKYEGGDKVKLVFSAPGERDNVDEQVSILDEELARYPNAICIATVDTSACLTQFELAEMDGIPIITFDSGSDYQYVAAHISTNNLEASATAARELAALLKESGDVALIVQDSLSMTAKEREQGFLDTIAEYSNIQVPIVYHLDELERFAIQITDEKNAGLAEDDENRAKSEDVSQEEVIRYLLEHNPNLKGIYTTNLDTTQLVARVLHEMEKDDLFFVGFDGGDEQFELLTNDVVDGLILQNPYGMGYATVVAAARTILDLGNEAFVDTDYTWLTKTNMEEASIQKFIY